MREEYVATIEHFNWNKLVYEADINFEPIVGETYHLYRIRGGNILSMIAPRPVASPTPRKLSAQCRPPMGTHRSERRRTLAFH
jgi:hypothetical protein